MTMTERLERRGVEKSIARGVKKVALRMLKEGVELVFIAKLTQLSITKIQQWQKESLKEQEHIST